MHNMSSVRQQPTQRETKQHERHGGQGRPFGRVDKDASQNLNDLFRSGLIGLLIDDLAR
jgi:hypothetical protein